MNISSKLVANIAANSGYLPAMLATSLGDSVYYLKSHFSNCYASHFKQPIVLKWSLT